MTTVAGFKARIVAGDFAFSGYMNDWSEGITVDMLDVTVPTSPSNAKQYIAGMSQSTLSLKGFLDVDGTSDAQYDQINDWFANASAEAVTFGPNGLAIGSEVLLSAGLATKAEIGAATPTPVMFGLDCQNSGVVKFAGVSLHDLTAETVDTSGTGVDGGAASTGGAIAHLHVTAFSGLSSAVFIIEDSANNSTWATIGTFATVAGLAQERLTIAGTVRRYTRYSVDVTGTGSVTFACAIART